MQKKKCAHSEEFNNIRGISIYLNKTTTRTNRFFFIFLIIEYLQQRIFSRVNIKKLFSFTIFNISNKKFVFSKWKVSFSERDPFSLNVLFDFVFSVSHQKIHFNTKLAHTNGSIIEERESNVWRHYLRDFIDIMSTLHISIFHFKILNQRVKIKRRNNVSWWLKVAISMMCHVESIIYRGESDLPLSEPALLTQLCEQFQCYWF